MECFKWGLVGHISRSIEDSGAKVILNCVGLAQEFLEKKNFSMFPRDRPFL